MVPAKKLLINRLREDLLGPFEANETLKAYPSDVYVTGILFPPQSDIAEEESDQLQTEGRVDINSSDDAAEEISLASAKRPASVGLSFVVESSGVPQINISFSAAVYRRVDDLDVEGGEENEESKKVIWRREPINWEGEEISLDFEHRDISAIETGVSGLAAHIRTSRWGNRLLVTVAMINANSLPKDEVTERESYEEFCFFQTQIEITICEATRFCARPLGGSAIDDDTRMARLIYRDVKEYAVGHTCSAEWERDGDEIGKVGTTWLPESRIKNVSSEGVGEFEHLSNIDSGPVLSPSWLSENSGETLYTGLEKLPDAYLEWLGKEAVRVSTLEAELAEQAGKHIERAHDVARRMTSSIELLRNNSDIEVAFRLANRAIMVQRQWAAPDEPPLVWRPFQLGFILLVLESLANEEHEDRSIADLLWFPTGGGKTEAYLALVAFTLFLRRIKYGEKGAGVASFMRYTLRLLTVQQFQRAASMICACDAIRQGEFLPDDANVNMGITPFSLGLWVGGDATPNRFNDAVDALNNSSAHNRPDQLKRCPRHIDVMLSWRADTDCGKVYATCDDPDCLWHKKPLPVWTVDSDVYSETPSLVIGTIDKFAQIARNEKTLALFGRGNDCRPPDLIIQDELHLISGPLGTLSGVYETAVDRICTTESGARPKVIASTATIRQASSQIKALFDRRTCLFPPPVLDAANSGFAVEDDNDPGRLYVGVTTAGRSAKFVLQATAASLTQSVKSDSFPEDNRDDFWTLVAYFNSLRELGGALVLMQDDVGDSQRNYAGRRGEVTRDIRDPMELTSRVSSTDLKLYLDRLEIKQGEPNCCDVVLASNMISVGVDVPRLGTMIVNGQPKGIAEYIQATSRVGRRRGGPGGLVVTIYNNAKARDRSHFETFRTWHLALYREVEATSVTPFAPRARKKALHAALVILARHLVSPLSKNVKGAKDHIDELEGFIEYIVSRAVEIDPEEASNVENELEDFLEKWCSSSSAYEKYWNDYAPGSSLMISAEKAAELQARSGSYRYRAVPTPNSMRNVEPGTLFKLEERLRP